MDAKQLESTHLRMDLAQDHSAVTVAGFERGAHPGQARADDQNVAVDGFRMLEHHFRKRLTLASVSMPSAQRTTPAASSPKSMSLRTRCRTAKS